MSPELAPKGETAALETRDGSDLQPNNSGRNGSPQIGPQAGARHEDAVPHVFQEDKPGDNVHEHGQARTGARPAIVKHVRYVDQSRQNSTHDLRQHSRPGGVSQREDPIYAGYLTSPPEHATLESPSSAHDDRARPRNTSPDYRMSSWYPGVPQQTPPFVQYYGAYSSFPPVVVPQPVPPSVFFRPNADLEYNSSYPRPVVGPPARPYSPPTTEVPPTQSYNSTIVVPPHRPYSPTTAVPPHQPNGPFTVAPVVPPDRPHSPTPMVAPAVPPPRSYSPPLVAAPVVSPPRSHSPVGFSVVPPSLSHSPLSSSSSRRVRFLLDEPYTSIDPFPKRLRSTSLFGEQIPTPTADIPTHDHTHDHYHDQDAFSPVPVIYRPTSLKSITVIEATTKAVYLFSIYILPRQLYLSLMLHLPSLYFRRVARVFEDAELSKPDIEEMFIKSAEQWDPLAISWYGPHSHPSANPSLRRRISPRLLAFKRSWEDFVESLLTEWKTLNIVSVLLLTAILTVLQIQRAESDPFARTMALFSLICAVMSLIFGCIYIVRFGTMKKMHKASSWAEDASRSKTFLLWNVWVFLSMPAVWLAWSLLLFLACIFCYIWRTGSVLDSDVPQLSPHAALGIRVSITGVFALGLLCFVMIFKTLSRYGSAMDAKWTKRASEWQKGSSYYAHKPFNAAYTSQNSSYVHVNPVRSVPHSHGQYHRQNTGSSDTWPEIPFVVDPALVEDYETSPVPATGDAISENLQWTPPPRPASV